MPGEVGMERLFVRLWRVQSSQEKIAVLGQSLAKDDFLLKLASIANRNGGNAMNRMIVGALLGASVAVPALAQENMPVEPALAPAPSETALAAAPALPAPPAPVVAPEPVQLLLAAGAPIQLAINEQLSSRTHDEGDNFSLTVVQDVYSDGQVVIPRGARAMGQVTWRTGTGAFGKSGKMEIAFRYLDIAGRRIPLRGMHRQEGEGNTAATVGAVLGAGVIGGLLVRGRRALVQEGREFTAFTVDPVPFAAEPGSAAFALAANYNPSPVATQLGEQLEDQEDERRERRSR